MNDENFPKLGPFKLTWVSWFVILSATLCLFLCNHDGYHFPWLTGIMYPLIVIAFVNLSIAPAPPALRDLLMSKREAMSLTPKRIVAFGFLWVLMSVILSLGYIQGLEYFKEPICTEHVIGRVISLEHTLSKGGSVEWAVYEFDVDGVRRQSAVKNSVLNLKPGREVDIAYTKFWPLHSCPQETARR